MAHDRFHSLSAAWLSGSMRGLGCSLYTAIPFLTDNSNSAGAEALFHLSGEPPMAIIVGNGRGMTDDGLLDAKGSHGRT